MNPSDEVPFALSDGNTFSHRYKIGEVIGQGKSKVYDGIRLSDSLPVAIKIVFKTIRHNVVGYIPREVRMLRQLSHVEGVIKLVDACYFSRMIIIVMEKIEFSIDLYSLLLKQYERTLPQSLTRTFFRQIIESLIQCRDAGVIHRDIKAENILVDLISFKIKIIDFGSAVPFQKQISGRAGTKEFWAPEMYSQLSYDSEASAVWALGFLLHNMACGLFCVNAINNQKDVPIRFPKEIHEDDECMDLICSLLKFRWEERPTMEEILHHPWMDLDSKRIFENIELANDQITFVNQLPTSSEQLRKSSGNNEAAITFQQNIQAEIFSDSVCHCFFSILGNSFNVLYIHFSCSKLFFLTAYLAIID